MVKNSRKPQKARKNNTSNKGNRRVVNPVLARMRAGLDAGAQAWLRLLADPCSAPLTPGCFQGMASGMLYRTRTTVFAGGAAVDSYLAFIPSNDINTTGYYPIQWCSVNTGGAAPTTQYGAGINGLPTGCRARCVAACIKIRYLGSELNRAGIVGHHLTNDPVFKGGYPAGLAAAVSPISTLQTTAQTLYRLGETKHEVRWVPSFNDGGYIQNAAGAGLYDNRDGNAVAMSVQGAPAGSIYYEVTAVWEVIPDSSSGLVPPEQAPRSSNTVNDVLRAIGDVAKFATDPTNRGTIYNIGRVAMGAGRVISSMVNPSVAGLLTM